MSEERFRFRTDEHQEAMAQPQEAKPTLAIVDDEPIVREGLAALFRSGDEFDVLAVGGSSREVLDVTAFRPPEIAVIDCGGRELEFESAVSLWRREASSTRIVALDDQVRDASIRQVIRLDLHGYAVKQDSLEEITRLIRATVHGRQAFSSSACMRVRKTEHGWQFDPREDVPGLHLLTSRELEILTSLAQGTTVKDAAAFLKISPNTIENHKARIMRKLQVRRMVDLVRFAMREGIA